MSQSDREHELGRLIAEFLKREQRGEPTDREALAKDNPDLADDLRSFFANHDQMHAAADAALGSQRVGLLDPTLEPGSSPGPNSAPTVPEHSGYMPRPKVGYFGDYELLAEVARGGMGVVFRARQVNLDRVVAIKMILAGQLAGDEDVRRFYQEAEAAANLEHPGIVPIFEVGQHAGQHFFSMGYVDGPNLAQVLTDGPLAPRDAATLVKLVAEAIAYAHDRGVIHRDLKPANVLLAKLDGSGNQRLDGVSLRAGTSGAPQGGFFQPKVTDFGLAKKAAADEGGLTGTGQILGTPSYMPPEQASGRISDIGAVSDVYSLGAILYATLTGRPPFQSDTPLNIVRQVLEQEPVSPRQLNPAVPRDLETICLKCLEKDRRKRYAGARELADELQRYLSGEPIRARRISAVERGWRWCQRKPAVAALFALCAAVLIALCIGGPWLAWKEHEIAQSEARLRKSADAARELAAARQKEAEEYSRVATEQRRQAEAQRKVAEEQSKAAQEQRKVAEEQRNIANSERTTADAERTRARHSLASNQIQLAKTARDNNETAEALTWYVQAYRNSPDGDHLRTSARNLIGAWGDSLRGTFVHGSGVHTLAVSPDGKRAMTASYGSRSHLWDLTTGQPIGKPQPHAGDVVSIEISADSRLALIADWDAAQVFDTATGKLRYPRLAHEVREDTVLEPAFSPDGRTIVTRDTFESIRLWDAESGQPRGKSLPHGSFVYAMRFSLDGQRVASLGGADARVWSVETGAQLGEPLTDLRDLALHPTKPIVAVCGADGKVRLRELPTGNQIAELAGDKSFQRVDFSGSGVNVVAAGGDQAVLWIHAGGVAPQQVELAHPGLTAAQFSPDGRYVLTSAPRSLKLWTVGKAGPSWEYSVRATDIRDWSFGYTFVNFSPDSSSVVAISRNQVAEVLSVGTGRLLMRELKVHEAAFTGDGRSLFAASDLGWVRWRTILPDDSWHLPQQPNLSMGDRVMALTFSPDGKQAVIAREKQGAQFVDASTWELDGKPLPHDWSLKGAAFSPDGRTLVTTSYLSRFGFGPTPDKVQIWDVATRQPIGEPMEHPATTPVFDVTGQTVHLGTSLLDLKTRAFISLPGFDGSAKSQPIASLVHWKNPAWPPLPALRDADTGELKTMQMPEVSENRAVLTSDGRGLITAHRDGTSRLWDAKTGQPLGPAFRPEGGPSERTSDGRFVVYDGHSTTRIWDAFAGRPCGEPLRNESANIYASFSPAGDKLATVWHFTANLWDSATGQALGPPMMQRSNGCDDVLFSPDGKLMIVLCQGVQRYRVPLPAADEPERLQLSVEVRTGLTVTENGTLQKLSQPEWLDRCRRLEQLGGPCDVQP